jgi:hypothetical protein
VHRAITKIRHFHQIPDDLHAPINKEYVSCIVPLVLNSTSRMSKNFPLQALRIITIVIIAQAIKEMHQDRWH